MKLIIKVGGSRFTNCDQMGYFLSLFTTVKSKCLVLFAPVVELMYPSTDTRLCQFALMSVSVL